MLELYHHGSSVCAAKVRFALAEKGLEWRGHYLDILKGDQFAPEYTRLNPKAVVPTLVHDGKVVTESTVICEYLEEVFPEPALLPRDPYLRHKARVWTKAVDEDVHPACAAVTFSVSHRHTLARLGKEKLEAFLSATPAHSITPEWKAQKRLYVERGLEAPGAADRIRLYDRYLKKMDDALADGDWLVGGRFSLADIALTPYVNRLAAMGLDGMWAGGRLPRVAAWFARIEARPAFKPALVDWVPAQLADDLVANGRRSWPEVARILQIA
jgi:glutathione S-transferase